MGKIIQVQLGEFRPVYYYDLNEVKCKRGDYVILEVDRGSEFGKIVSDVSVVNKPKMENVKGKVLRKATEGDLKQIENNRMKARDALNTCVRRIAERRLSMRRSIIFYRFKPENDE